MADDPYVLAFVKDDPQTYGGPLYAQQDFDAFERPTYQYDDLLLLKDNADNKALVDRALESIHDLSLTAEVHRYRMACVRARELEVERKKLEDRLFEYGRKQGESIRRLEAANVLARLDDEMVEIRRRESAALRARDEERETHRRTRGRRAGRGRPS